MRALIALCTFFTILASVVAAQGYNKQNNRQKHPAPAPVSELTAVIIGSGSPVYNSQRSGPSVLIRYNDVNILVDMGNGTIANLDKAGFAVGDINALLFTHHHYDHNEEMIPIFIQKYVSGNSFLVAGPENTQLFITSILALYSEDITYRTSRSQQSKTGTYEVKELSGNDTFEYKGITITTAAVKHSITTIAYRFEAGGRSIVISGDTAYSDTLIDLAKNTDVLIIDSGSLMNNEDRTTTVKKNTAHSSLDELIKMVSASQANKIVLTHFTKRTIDENLITDNINSRYKGTVIFATDLLEIK